MSEHIGEVVWQGGLEDGHGKINLESEKLDQACTFSSRFGEATGTNPEELLGAAHATCFSMALAHLLESAGFRPEEIKTQDHVKLESSDGKYTISDIHIITEAKVPGMKEAEFQEKAEEAKRNCPVSVALSATPMTLSASLRTL